MSMWRLSAGTLGAIGKSRAKNEVLPTTAYVMIGEKCRNNCKFCAQARESQASGRLLSRITWPEIPAAEAVAGIAGVHAAGGLQRVCLQVVDSEGSQMAAVKAVNTVKSGSAVPVCVSSAIKNLAQAEELIAAGAERICIALDAATAQVHAAAKEGDWQTKRLLLSECARALPGRVTTHLIIGLGETEEEMVDILAECVQEGITVALFAFTPVRGTAWADRQAPPLGQYRRLQVVYHLLKSGFDRQAILFSRGQIVRFEAACLAEALAGGKAFETSGCPGCNRPYYNERPGGIMYNYPRPLTASEFEQALKDCELAKEACYEVAGH